MKERLKEIQEALLTGVSYMLPFVISGGLLVAIGFLLGGYNIPNDVAMGGNFASTVFWLGKAAFGLMVPILGAYTAYSIADKPGIAPGMIAGVLLKKIPMPAALRSLLPTLIIPLLGVAAMGLIMVYVIGGPIAAVTNALTDMLNSLGTGNLVLLGIIQGCMLAFDMGGPCNKVAYAFALAAMDTGNYLVMGANFVGSITPPLGIALAILFKKSRFTKAERGSLAGLFAGAVGMITEFAIPFAASDPIKVIPSLMAGSAVGCTLSYLLGLTIQAPHGGLFVMFAMNSPLNFILASVVGALVTAAILVALKKDAVEEEE